MPEGGLCFGFMSITKASAADLRAHVLHAVLPRTPDAVCLLAPSSNLSNNMHIKNLGVEFGRLLISVCNLWPKANIFVLFYKCYHDCDTVITTVAFTEFVSSGVCSGLSSKPANQDEPAGAYPSGVSSSGSTDGYVWTNSVFVI